MKILLAVDGSKYSEGAAGFLTFLNLSEDDEITVFHALYWSRFLYDEKSYREAIKEIKRLFVPRVLDSALSILGPVKAKISTAVAEGPASQTIMGRAAEAGMDLIVMGARGMGGVESILLGSVTRAVAIKSPIPVLVTRLPLSVRPGGMKILFATDGSEYSVSTMKFLSSMPFPGNSEITVLNVMKPVFLDMYMPAFTPEINERFIAVMEKARESERAESGRIAGQARDYLSGRFRKTEVLSAEGDPTAEILAASEAMKADLIAVGCRGLTGIRGMMGSVSRNVLSHSKCPVLIGKMCED
ncbi:MAG: universal stress protein [Nitrospiraceae bacterium]|nr:universal stress protein [Nitrospiraceae bacterium]